MVRVIAVGNLSLENTGGSLTTYIWDTQSHLTGVSSATAGIETYIYTADGMRQKKVTPSSTVNFIRDNNNILIETDGSLITQAHYTDFPGRWGGLTSERRSRTSSFYGFDPQGRSRILVSIGGAITYNDGYNAFGEEYGVTGSATNPYRYVGMFEYHRDTANRQYVRARYLDVISGRWISRDLIGFDGGDWNLYRYVRNSPIMMNDPRGLDPCPQLYNPLVTDPPKNPYSCGDCYNNIFITFGPTLNHYCHHYYAHCTMCCILTRSFGVTCANKMQHFEITSFDEDNPANKTKNNARWHGCNKGKAIANSNDYNNMPCAVACLQPRIGFPWPECPKSSICNNRPFKIGKTCADYLKNPTPFGNAGPACIKQ